MKKILIALTVFILKICGALLSTIKDFVLYMVAILLAVLISKGIFMSVAYISQNGFSDFFGSIFAAGLIGGVLFFVGGPVILVAMVVLAVFLIGAVVVVTFILNAISQVVLSVIVGALDSACNSLYYKLAIDDGMRKNRVFTYLALTPAYKITVVNIIASLPVIYYAFIILNKIVVFADKGWDLKVIYSQFTSNQQIICLVMGILFCFIARACGTLIFDEN